MDALLCKLIATPVLIGAIALAGRRFGDRRAGWLAGLPLTSGPVSVFLAAEQGAEFAANAAVATLAGCVSVLAFCVAYARAARHGVAAGVAAGLTAFVVSTAALRATAPGVSMSLLLACAGLALAARAIGAERVPLTAAPGRRDHLLPRMATATAIVLALTAGAPALGATLAGLLSPLPVFAGTLAAFAHHRAGPAAARALLRGVVAGTPAFAAFFFVVAALLRTNPPPAVYAAATATALALGGALLARRARLPGLRSA